MPARNSLAAALLLAAAAARAGELQVPAVILRAIDGDTLAVRAAIWPDHTVETSIRVRGVDAPELKGKCPAERAKAAAARAFVAALPAAVVLSDIRPDKYGGRYDARVTLADGRDLAAALIFAGLGRPYDGGKRGGWC